MEMEGWRAASGGRRNARAASSSGKARDSPLRAFRGTKPGATISGAVTPRTATLELLLLHAAQQPRGTNVPSPMGSRVEKEGDVFIPGTVWW